MTLQAMQSRVRFLTDRKGKRTHAVLPISQYQHLLENLYDNALADSRENEGTILKLQMSSRSYLDWVGPENDIYDEVFQE